MRYLVTGHTGFKGAWLTLMLAARGHEVCGLSLDPAPGALYETAGLSDVLAADLRGDVRDAAATASAVARCRPDVVLHLAAQALVRDAYRDPRGTYETNVMGTFNVLEAAAATDSVKGILVVTTDKVYRNVGRSEGYAEHDPLGGDDPYSASKAMADILTASWARSHDLPLAIARAGNVIGGGDVSRDRLLPDLLAAYSQGRTAVLRYPGAVRPWQHVLDCLGGYLTLIEAVLAGQHLGAWNFGPEPTDFVSVGEVADRVAALWGDGSWQTDGGQHPHEAAVLTLDPSKARERLGWAGRLSTDEALSWTVDWARQVGDGQHPAVVTRRQIDAFQERVR